MKEKPQWVKDLVGTVFKFDSAYKGEFQYVADGYFISARPHYRGAFDRDMSISKFSVEAEWFKLCNKETKEFYEEDNY